MCPKKTRPKNNLHQDCDDQQKWTLSSVVLLMVGFAGFAVFAAFMLKIFFYASTPQ